MLTAASRRFFYHRLHGFFFTDARPSLAGGDGHGLNGV